jgi:RNA polymerase sigma-70 factor (ECF subfamily)
LQTEQIAEVAPDETDDVSCERLKSSLARRALALMQKDFEERTWQAFWLTAVDGRDPAEAAQQLGMPRASVYMARSRVLRRLRQELDGLDPTE